MNRLSSPDEEEMTPRQLSRQRQRDRRRTVRMVVDNAGVRRIAKALARRTRGSSEDGPTGS